MSQEIIWTKERIHHLLDTNPQAVMRAAIALLERQTPEEKAGAYTRLSNGVGYSKFDAESMTRFCSAVKSGARISDKWLAYARGRCKRYWRQLVDIANETEMGRKAALQSQTQSLTEQRMQIAEPSSAGQVIDKPQLPDLSSHPAIEEEYQRCVEQAKKFKIGHDLAGSW